MPRFVTVKELLDSGRIGQLRSVSIRNERPGPVGEADHGGVEGRSGDLGRWPLRRPRLSHPRSAGLAPWSGDPCDRSRDEPRRTLPSQDLVTGVFSFRSGVEGVGVWNYDSFQYKDQVEIIGTAGALSFSCFADEPLRLLTARGVEQIEAPYPETVQVPLIQTVVNALTGHGESPSNGQSAVRTARVIDGLLSD